MVGEWCTGFAERTDSADRTGGSAPGSAGHIAAAAGRIVAAGRTVVVGRTVAAGCIAVGHDFVKKWGQGLAGGTTNFFSGWL